MRAQKIRVENVFHIVRKPAADGMRAVEPEPFADFFPVPRISYRRIETRARKGVFVHKFAFGYFKVFAPFKVRAELPRGVEAHGAQFSQKQAGGVHGARPVGITNFDTFAAGLYPD